MTDQPPNQFISFWTYFSECFVPFQRVSLPLKPLHKGVCEVLQRAVLGELGKSYLVINIPPRVGKTMILNALSTWMLAYFPDSQIIYTSYANNLVERSIRYVQDVIKAKWYQELFPNTQLGSIRKANEFNTTQGGVVYGDGVGGGLTGYGGGLKRKAGGFIVVDDAAKPDESLSRVEADKLKFWFENTLTSRRNSSQWTPIIICAQRLAPEDLPGFVLEQYHEDTHLIKYAAMVDGESQIPETRTTEDLLALKRVNPFAFASQYQQEPIILGGNLIKIENFRYYPYGEPPKLEFKVITCDTAMKAKEHNDYTVLQCWGRSLKRAFLLDQVRGKWSPDALIKNAATFYRKHNDSKSPVSRMVIEEAAAGFTLIQELRKKGIPARGVIRHKDKVTRVKDILNFQATGMVWLPKGASWLQDFEVECAQFREDGKAPRDDQVDCLADGILECLGRGTSILAALGKDRRTQLRQLAKELPLEQRAMAEMAANLTPADARPLTEEELIIRARVRELTKPRDQILAKDLV